MSKQEREATVRREKHTEEEAGWMDDGGEEGSFPIGLSDTTASVWRDGVGWSVYLPALGTVLY